MLGLFTINTVAELICFLVSLICLYKVSNPVWRSMIIFMLLTCVVEMVGVHLKHLYKQDPKHALPNVWLYNLFRLVETGFMSCMFHELLKPYIKTKPLLLISTSIILVTYVFEWSTRGLFTYFGTVDTVISVIFILYGLYYFYQLLKGEAFYDLKVYAPFWWVSGVLFFYFGNIINAVFHDILTEKLSLLIVGSKNYITSYIYNALNILLYGCWSYSFVCKKWEKQTSRAY